MFEKLFEACLNEQQELPDWVLRHIETYLTAFETGEIKGEPFAEDVLDFVVSNEPGQELTDELRVAAMEYINRELPPPTPIEPEDEEYDPDGKDWDPVVASWQEDDEDVYPDVENIELHPHGDLFTLVDKTSGEILSKAMSKEDAEQLLHHIAQSQ